MKDVLLIFAKNPVHGQVKTRLAATVGNDLAVSVYQRLLEHTKSVSKDLPLRKIVYYADYINQNDIWNNEVYEKQKQNGEDLGVRIKNAFKEAFESGADKVAIIGTDCFEISSALLMNSFAYLKTYDVVLGPARDGGYYLLAMKKLHEQLFVDINWSSGAELLETVEKCKGEGLSVFSLPELSDIDDENDLVNQPSLIAGLQHD